MEKHSASIKIQRWYRGWIVRIKRLPTVLYAIQKYLMSIHIKLSKANMDGRINSSINEDKVVELLSRYLGSRLKVAKLRMWYDILVQDYYYGWLPVNIKITTTATSDNTGNLAMCVYAYTDEPLDIHRENSYQNGRMSRVLLTKLRTKHYNTNNKKDYYFLVLNKNNPNDVIVNSLKGLSVLTPNINNLPFQVKWKQNKQFRYQPIADVIKTFIACLQRPEPSWKEQFMTDIRALKTVTR